MAFKKILLGKNVLDATAERIKWTLDNFKRVCVSFSGGKDSTVMLHLVCQQARKVKLKVNVLFIDWEVQFTSTINHIKIITDLYADVIDNLWWVALPLTTQNSLSQHQPEWQCWAQGVAWVRQPPQNAITNEHYFPFYRKGMTFEHFVSAFAEWFSQQRPAAIMIGIRADESYNRLRSLFSTQKQRFADDMPWTTLSPGCHSWYVYPIYDWKAADIWTWFSHTGCCYNPLYNLMFQAGVSVRNMRICEPFGPEQRKGLWLYHIIEPERWAMMCERVAGVKSGGIYAGYNEEFYGRGIITKPSNLSWKEYAMLLLESMPHPTAEHYKNKISVYLHWYQKKGMIDIPDSQSKDMGARDIPSWRRICKVLLQNDYWCRALSFSPNKPENYLRYTKRIKLKRKEWGIFCDRK